MMNGFLSRDFQYLVFDVPAQCQPNILLVQYQSSPEKKLLSTQYHHFLYLGTGTGTCTEHIFGLDVN